MGSHILRNNNLAQDIQNGSGLSGSGNVMICESRIPCKMMSGDKPLKVNNHHSDALALPDSQGNAVGCSPLIFSTDTKGLPALFPHFWCYLLAI